MVSLAWVYFEAVKLVFRVALLLNRRDCTATTRLKAASPAAWRAKLLQGIAGVPPEKSS